LEAHATFFPEIIEEKNVDAVCIGEAEETIVDFFQKYKTTSEIESWWIREKNGTIKKNKLKPLVQNLDLLSFPDRRLFYDKYELARNSKIKSFITARGCPYNCTYCFNHAFVNLYGTKTARRVRTRSVDNVIEEILYVKNNFPLEFVHFATDTFIVDKNWIEEFAVKYKEKIGLPFFCGVRVELVTEELADLLHYAGCNSVSMGIECGNYELRKNLLKRNQTNKMIIKAAQILNRRKINILSQNMIGLPGETFDNMLETLDINIYSKVSYAEVSFYQPYPRTALGKVAEASGLFSGNVDDISESFNKDIGIRIINPKEIRNLHKLFAIVVQFPFLRHYIKLLVKIPENILYKIAFKILKGYKGKFKIFPHKLSLKEYIVSIKRYLIDSGEYR